ncbi:hypothetical protein WR25_17266 [Diploscapter pachys]|uniref:Uncharacterized protein n=1 Tax=Diploscapter pachys TaxID=2018661 RepID=A0A2A2K9E0_9BILA|nr:hypothetical protein WR25_17266 [Diploscapter pachys]
MRKILECLRADEISPTVPGSGLHDPRQLVDHLVQAPVDTDQHALGPGLAAGGQGLQGADVVGGKTQAVPTVDTHHLRRPAGPHLHGMGGHRHMAHVVVLTHAEAGTQGQDVACHGRSPVPLPTNGPDAEQQRQCLHGMAPVAPGDFQSLCGTAGGAAQAALQLLQARPGCGVARVGRAPGLPCGAGGVIDIAVMQAHVPVHRRAENGLHASSTSRQCISARARCLRTVLTETPRRSPVFS